MRGQHEQSELIQFIQAQNKLLRQENREFKDLIKLNREALKIALSPTQKESQLPQLVRLLFEENSKLLGRCKQLREQLQEKSCQVLISQQIASASNEHEKYVAAELKERLKVLKKQIDTKHRKIQELTKMLGKNEVADPEHGEIRTIVVEYSDINKITEKMFKESQSLRKEIEMKGQEIQKLKEQKQELVKLNLILTKQVNELKAFSCQTTTSIKRDANNSSTDLSKFLKYQSKIAENSQDDSEGPPDSNSDNENSSDSSLSEYQQQVSEEKEQKVQSKAKFNLSLNLKKQQSPQKNDKPAPKVVPKLDFKKARQIQSLIIKKINNDEKKKAGQNHKDQKAKKYEAEVQELRKKLGNQIILKLRYEKENIFLKKFICELEQRNALLINERHEKTIEKEYERERMLHEQENMETLLDICRDVTMNQRLKQVCKGRQRISRRDGYSKDI